MDTPAPRVSVVIPFRGRPDWLRTAVESALAQTLEEIEVIVVDDGSHHDLSNLGGGDPRITVLRQDGRGPAAARNRGLAVARAEFVAFLDADDAFEPTKLERQLALMEARPEALLSHTSYHRSDEHLVALEVVRSGSFVGDVYPEVIRHCPIATPTTMVRRSAFADGLSFDEATRFGEDTLLWIELAKRAPVLGLDAPLARVRVSGANAFSDPSAQIASRLRTAELAVKGEPRLRFVERRTILSWIYLDVAMNHRRLGRPWAALVYFLRSVAAWPFSRRHVVVPFFFLRRRARPGRD